MTYYSPTATNTYTNNTAYYDYFRNATTSTTTSTGTTHLPCATVFYDYDQMPTYTVPYNDLLITIQDPYYQPIQEYHSIEPVCQQPQTPEQIKEEIEATERAKNLLLEYLDEDNKQRFLNNKRLEISSKLFDGVKYHIPLSKVGRIKAWKENMVITELCLLVKETEQLPTEDIILTKLLYALHDERYMLKTAKHFNIKENLLLELNQ